MKSYTFLFFFGAPQADWGRDGRRGGIVWRISSAGDCVSLSHICFRSLLVVVPSCWIYIYTLTTRPAPFFFRRWGPLVVRSETFVYSINAGGRVKRGGK